jgi:hypothetical protein
LISSESERGAAFATKAFEVEGCSQLYREHGVAFDIEK